jgi:hypothetical protein
MTVCISPQEPQAVGRVGREPAGSARPGQGDRNDGSHCDNEPYDDERRDRMKASVPQVDPKTYKADGASRSTREECQLLPVRGTANQQAI